MSNDHPFKEEYDRLLDMNRDELLHEIKKHIDDYFEYKLSVKNRKADINEFFRGNWHVNSIETYYWKFINKETKVDEE